MGFSKDLLARHVITSEQGKIWKCEVVRVSTGKGGTFQTIELYKEYEYKDRNTGEGKTGRDHNYPLGSLRMLVKLLEAVDRKYNNGSAFADFRVPTATDPHYSMDVEQMGFRTPEAVPGYIKEEPLPNPRMEQVKRSQANQSRRADAPPPPNPDGWTTYDDDDIEF